MPESKVGTIRMEALKWMLAGAGDIANRRVGPVLVAARRSTIVAICDFDRKRGRAAGGADAVYIATPRTSQGGRT